MRDRNPISAPDTVERRSGTTPTAADVRIARDFFGGSIRLHILHHARQGPVFGVGLMEELAHHGYRLSPGTLYPILHALESGGYLAASDVLVDGRRRRTYRATALGRSTLRAARKPILELVHELFPET